MNKRSQVLLVAGLIGVAFLGRLIPHPPNFSPFLAISWIAGLALPKRLSVIVPLSALFLSDLFLGFHNTASFVYGSMIVAVMLGQWVQRNPNWFRGLFSLISASLIFFLITNFGVFIVDGYYPLTLRGFSTCFTLAIPFYQYSLIGDIVYGLIFYGYVWLAFGRSLFSPDALAPTRG